MRTIPTHRIRCFRTKDRFPVRFHLHRIDLGTTTSDRTAIINRRLMALAIVLPTPGLHFTSRSRLFSVVSSVSFVDDQYADETLSATFITEARAVRGWTSCREWSIPRASLVVWLIRGKHGNCLSS